ncbi:MAG TPA: hypothetical protein DCM86_19620 [Verrucomicrobiales bacterium]|nr:hypothetical protein [Verrucomicrobiales bacterium]
MKKLSAWYGPHLAVGEIAIPAGGEWQPRMSTWCLIHVVAGGGYWLQPRTQHLLDASALLFLSPALDGTVRASQIGELRLLYVPVEPERLTGLFTLDEQRNLKSVAARREGSFRIMPPSSSLATRMKSLCELKNRTGPAFRLHLLQLFCEACGSELTEPVPEAAPAPDAKARLRELLNQTPTSELLGMSFSELGRLTRCTPRHLSRIFQELVGVSFRDKHTELRLSRACELLATSEAKIVDVAMESGYQSLSLFNLMFTRRFGVSPGRWRQNLRKQHGSTPAALRPERALAGAGR